MESPDHVAAVILAAGQARRFGSPKQLAQLRGRTLLEHVIAAARGAGLAPIIVVVPPDLPVGEADVSLVVNSQPDLGMSHSLQLGFATLPPDADAAVILLGDQPTVDGPLITRLLAARGPTPFVGTRFGEVLMPPVLVKRSHFELVAQPHGDIGLRRILRAHAELVTAVDLDEPPADVDTMADLQAIGG
jgi:CTP:molybdopterin cytidylyltransferase MocA